MNYQLDLTLDGHCSGPLFAPPQKVRPPVRPRGKEGVVHRAQTRRATPKWLSAAQRQDIARFYSVAKKMSETLGELYVVDHIVPKISPWVCGLHVPWNLQVLHWQENNEKANVWWPDSWFEQTEFDIE